MQPNLRPTVYCPRYNEETERMVHLIAHADLERLETICRNAGRKRVRSEGTQHNGEACKHGPETKERSHHLL
jgi:hypothetical protein